MAAAATVRKRSSWDRKREACPPSLAHCKLPCCLCKQEMDRVSTTMNRVRYRRVGAGQDGKEIAQRNEITEGAGDIEDRLYKTNPWGAGRMAQPAKESATKPADICLIPRAHMVKGENSTTLTSDLQT